jgi:hypothetical protein
MLCAKVKRAYDARWVNAHSVLHSVAFALDPEYLYVKMGANEEVTKDIATYVGMYYGKGTEKAIACMAQYATFRSAKGIFADENVRACASRMPAYEWWETWGGTLPLLREIAKRVLAQPVGAGAGERNWSTYGFIVDKRRNKLSVDRARKLVYVHFNVRLLQKVHAVDYTSEYFAWEVEEEAEEEADVAEVQDESPANKGSDSDSDSDSYSDSD